MHHRASSLLWKYIHPSHTGVTCGGSKITMCFPSLLFQGHYFKVTYSLDCCQIDTLSRLSVFNLGNARIQHSYQGFDAVNYPITELSWILKKLHINPKGLILPSMLDNVVLQCMSAQYHMYVACYMHIYIFIHRCTGFTNHLYTPHISSNL